MRQQISFDARLCWHDRRCSFSLASLKNWKPTNTKRWRSSRSLHPEVDQAYELVQQFREMVRTRTGEQLDGWLGRVKASHIREFQGFVAGVLRDKEAVQAGLTRPASNGIGDRKSEQTETHQADGLRESGLSSPPKAGSPRCVAAQQAYA
jgi:Transposase